jgi:hypothetical protein
MMYELEAMPDPGQPQFDLQNFQHANDDYWAAVKNVLVPKIAEYNISIDQLKGTFQEIFKGFVHGPELSEDFGLGYCTLSAAVWTVSAISYEILFCMPSKFISFIGQHSICFRVLTNDIKLWPIIFSYGTTYTLFINDAAYKENNFTRWPFSLDFSGTGRSTPPPQSERSFEKNFDFCCCACNSLRNENRSAVANRI